MFFENVMRATIYYVVGLPTLHSWRDFHVLLTLNDWKKLACNSNSSRVRGPKKTLFIFFSQCKQNESLQLHFLHFSGVSFSPWARRLVLIFFRGVLTFFQSIFYRPLFALALLSKWQRIIATAQGQHTLFKQSS